MNPTPEIAELLAEQRAYYEARAEEYDQWWERRGRYDLGPEGNALWQDEIRKLEAVFNSAPLAGQVLEPAGGTGNWTQYLARRAERVTVVDASAAMIEANRQRLRKAGLLDRVRYVQGDLLHWSSDERFDAVFLAFWISHLPSPLLEPFLSKMVSVLKPGGILVVLEGLPKWEDPALALVRRREGTLRLSDEKEGGVRLSGEIELRTLNDGRTFRIVKRYDNPAELSRRLTSLGLKPYTGTTGEQFFYAIAHKQNLTR